MGRNAEVHRGELPRGHTLAAMSVEMRVNTAADRQRGLGMPIALAETVRKVPRPTTFVELAQVENTLEMIVSRAIIEDIVLLYRD